MELLAQVGHDLPGAVRILPDDVSMDESQWETTDDSGAVPLVPTGGHPGWRFSLAGVQLKFSMLSERDRLTMPAFGEGGDWIVKLPDRQYPDVPSNEFAMMSLASMVGIDVPQIRLVHRDEIEGLPANAWPGNEVWAYAIRRFDREAGRRLVHIEDLAQVCNVYPDRKYSGNYESVASLIYRQHDLPALHEFTRRLTFIILISNGDAHLKNWSLIYRDQRIPTLSPAYDLVSTAAYRVGNEPEDLGLRFGGTKLFERIGLETFRRLERRLGATNADLVEHVVETATRVRNEWPRFRAMIEGNPQLKSSIDDSIADRSKTLLRNL